MAPTDNGTYLLSLMVFYILAIILRNAFNASGFSVKPLNSSNDSALSLL